MAETAVEIARCEACGADVRDESQFCYNCGASVTATPARDVREPTPAPARDAHAPTPARELRAPAPAKDTHAIEGSQSVDSNSAKRPPLRSAASMRKQRRAFNRQPVEVSWVQPEGSPKAFVITTIVLVVGAVVLLVLAFYLQ